MYQADTILALKEPKYIDDENKAKPLSEYKGKKGEERAFPYNRVKVVAQSPIIHANKGNYEGSEAQGVIIQPLTEFASTLDEPYGKLIRLYDVESIPEDDIATGVVASDRGFHQVPASKQLPPSPEDLFRAARDNPDAPPSPTRVRTPMSPLEDVEGAGDDSPLGG